MSIIFSSSPPLPPINTESAAGSFSITSAALALMISILSSPNFLAFCAIRSQPSFVLSTAYTVPYKACMASSTETEPVPAPMSYTMASLAGDNLLTTLALISRFVIGISARIKLSSGKPVITAACG